MWNLLCQYNNIYAGSYKYLKEKKVQTEDWRKKKKNPIATLPLEQTKSNVAFTYSPNKCHNIFTKHLFSVIVSHSFKFYYFILNYKKLTPQ